MQGKAGDDFRSKFLNEDLARLTSALAETIIPRTDTPGAIDAGVPGFIDDLLLAPFSSTEQQNNFIEGITAFAIEAKSALGKNFEDATPEEQLSFVKQKNSELLSGGGAAQSEGWWAAGTGKGKPFFLEMKRTHITWILYKRSRSNESTPVQPGTWSVQRMRTTNASGKSVGYLAN